MRTHTALFTPHRVALAAACLCVGLARAQTAPAPSQLPSGGKVVGGNASISATGSTLNINQSSNRAAIDWNSFNVGSDARVHGEVEIAQQIDTEQSAHFIVVLFPC